MYRKTARYSGPVMAMAAKTTIAEVAEVVDVGAIDPEKRGHAKRVPRSGFSQGRGGGMR